jgi:aryl-alcohol dehydrogenase-like predicted oxidoreductase
MEMRRLGRSGPEVSLVGLGCNNFGARLDFNTTREVVHKALDLGITLFDTADVYGNRGTSEEFLGRILGRRRQDVVLATKFGMPMDDAGTLQGRSHRYVMLAVESSLRRLRTDWIDLYQLHRPDPATPIEETLRALEDLVRAGKVRHIGCSKFSAAQLMEATKAAAQHGLRSFVSCQEEYSLLAREPEREFTPALQTCGVGLLPYYPLASGLLSGKYVRGAPLPPDSRMRKMPDQAQRILTERNWAVVERLQAFCAARGRTLLELAFSWLVRQPTIASVIAGASTPEQVELNARAAAWALTPSEFEEIDRLTAAP